MIVSFASGGRRGEPPVPVVKPCQRKLARYAPRGAGKVFPVPIYLLTVRVEE